MMKKTCLLLTSAILITSSNSFAQPAVKEIVKPSSLLPAKGTQKHKFDADHPFNRALISAFNTNPQLRSKVKEQYITAEGVSQALGGWRPTIKLQGTVGRSWTEAQSPVSYKLWNSSQGASAVLQQNLFSGGQTLAQTEKAKAQVYAGFADLASTEQKVLLNAINVYLDLWSKKLVLDLNTSNVELKQETLNQTQARYEVGEVTLTDVSQAEAGLAGAIAQRYQTEAELAIAKDTYIQVIGEMPGAILAPPPLTELREMPKDRHEIETKAAKNHPDIRNAEFVQKASLANIDVATSTLLPSVDFNASTSRDLKSNNSRSNGAEFGVKLVIPLYQQGNEWSKIRETSQSAAKSKIDKVTVQRAVQQDAMKNWESWVSAAYQIDQLKIQIEAAKVTLEGTRQENMVGERTLLDVLTAENSLLQAETNLTNAQKTYLVVGYSILASLGELMAIDLGLPVEPYPVKENYEEVSSQWIGTSNYPTR